MRSSLSILFFLAAYKSQGFTVKGLGSSLEGKVFRTKSLGGGRYAFVNQHNKSDWYTAGLRGEPTDLLFFTSSTAFVSDGRNAVYSISDFGIPHKVEAKIHCVVSPDDMIVDIAKADSSPSTPWILAATNRYSKGALWVCPTYPQKPYIQAVFTDEIASLDTSPDRKIIYFLTKKSSKNGKRIGVYDMRQSRKKNEQELKTLVQFPQEDSQEDGRIRADRNGNIYTTWSKADAVQSFDKDGKFIQQYSFEFKPRYIAIGGGNFSELTASDSHEYYSKSIAIDDGSDSNEFPKLILT